MISLWYKVKRETFMIYNSKTAQTLKKLLLKKTFSGNPFEKINLKINGRNYIFTHTHTYIYIFFFSLNCKNVV